MKAIKQIITANVFIATIFFSTQIYAQAEPTRIELRAMQTRKFNKSPEEVGAAIISLFKDKNISCLESKQTMAPMETFQLPMPKPPYPPGFDTKSLLRTKGWKVTKPGEIVCITNGREYKFELVGQVPESKDPKGFEVFEKRKILEQMKPTIVRLRIIKNPTMEDMSKPLWRPKSFLGKLLLDDEELPASTQSYAPEDYQKIFKEIADGLFIDAIEINPATME